MGHPARFGTTLGVLALWLGVLGLQASGAAAAGSEAVVQGVSPEASTAPPVGSTPASAPVEFDVSLQLTDPAGAESLAQAVSNPQSPSYGKYLTPSAWEARFSPAESSVSAVSSWLRSEGINVVAITPDRMTIEASAPAASVEKAFGTTLEQFNVAGRQLRLAKQSLHAPASIASLISGISGVDQTLVRPEGLAGAPKLEGSARLTGADTERSTARKRERSARTLPPAFVVGKPCSNYFGEKLDTTDPAYGDGFPYPMAYAPCGYTPPQIQGAYGLNWQIARGVTGRGVKVAIVDALASPTLFADAQRYSENNQAGQVLEPSQFSEVLDTPFEVTEECVLEEEWADEQHLDVESLHATAPGADIVYVGAKTCSLPSLENAVQQVVDGHLASIVTDSWGEGAGDLLEPEEQRKAFDNVLLMADATGIGVQFSSGDEGDNYTVVGADIPDYPASSPFSTAVGGTSVEIGQRNERLAEFGWSTARSVLCTQLLEELELPGCTSSLIGSWVPPAPGAYDYGGGGGTTYNYREPWYQYFDVPSTLALRNAAITHERNRVIPDISMDGDPSTGFLVGEMQEFPSGPQYNEYRLGGTSLSSPLFAGVMADADQAAGRPLGFANPLLYFLDALPFVSHLAYDDILPAGKRAIDRIDYLNGINSEEGILTSVRVIGSEGVQEFCEEEQCQSQQNILQAAPGFDSMTGIGSPGAWFVPIVGFR